MKLHKNPLIHSSAILFACLSVAVAADNKAKAEVKAHTPHKSQNAKASATQRKSDEPVKVTGSHIKREVRRRGFITDTPNQVVVIDQHAIQRSGASDLRQLLNRYGYR